MTTILKTAHVFLLMLSLTAAGAALAQIYRTTDEHGNTVFTDKEPADSSSAEKVEVRPVLTIPATPVNSRPNRGSKKATAINVTYKSVTITSPASDTSFPHPEQIEIAVQSSPALVPGHVYRLLVNGQKHQDSESDSLILKQPDRGALVLQVQIVNTKGKVLAASPESTIFVHRPSIHFNKPAPIPDGPITIQ